ncbi:MAG: ribosome-associated translation inhibitor RaiA [Acidobacteriota bacterium]
MNLEWTARNYTLGDDVKELSQKKLAKVGRYVDDPAEAHLIFETEKNRQIAELILRHRHGQFQAREEADDMRDAVYSVVDKVEKQARRARRRFQDRRRRAQRQAEAENHWPVTVIESPSEIDDRPQVVKTTKLPIKPMSVREAALMLESSKNDFYVFLNESTSKVSVLYRRRDQNFGLIAPEV